MSITVTPVPAFSDNYLWLIHHQSHAAIVDPGDARPVLQALEQKQLKLSAILITHHHWDHTNGIGDLLEKFPGIPVYAPARERIPHATHSLTEADTVSLDELGIQLEVLDVPGHTAGHIAYRLENKLFCGDTLFASGCGRVFDGTFEDLCHSLEKIATLPTDTQIYCAHEYTVDNLGFALWVEPDNQDIKDRMEQCHALLDADQATVPTQLSVELRCNPFLRTTIPAVKAQAEKHLGKKLEDNCQVFTTLRQWKDQYYD